MKTEEMAFEIYTQSLKDWWKYNDSMTQQQQEELVMEAWMSAEDFKEASKKYGFIKESR